MYAESGMLQYDEMGNITTYQEVFGNSTQIQLFKGAACRYHDLPGLPRKCCKAHFEELRIIISDCPQCNVDKRSFIQLLKRELCCCAAWADRWTDEDVFLPKGLAIRLKRTWNVDDIQGFFMQEHTHNVEGFNWVPCA